MMASLMSLHVQQVLPIPKVPGLPRLHHHGIVYIYIYPDFRVISLSETLRPHPSEITSTGPDGVINTKYLMVLLCF
jgi:hypothetical protein